MWQLSLEDIEEKIFDIRKQFDSFLGAYNETDPKFVYIIESFDEPRDRLLRRQVYKHREESFFNILGDIEYIMEDYGRLIGYEYDEDEDDEDDE